MLEVNDKLVSTGATRIDWLAEIVTDMPFGCVWMAAPQRIQSNDRLQQTPAPNRKAVAQDRPRLCCATASFCTFRCPDGRTLQAK